MALEEIYKLKTTEELIYVLEGSDLYSKECLEVVFKEFEKRSIDKKSLKSIAKTAYRKRLRDIFTSTSFMQTTVNYPKSQFLTEKESRTIYLQELQGWKIGKNNLQEGASNLGDGAQ